ncbi:Oidioi.mRNA.OKI2018_I69.XSR.g13538.t1.cds [Oikopleura dioica]|uniref:Oidioi.mRNA.OKI2018_I69.XSR.g13538.t1.cds n=1 Tax=Oikopleura dioica TaxID=34765 RepID=A0ABN7S760_OIKDI|nr:Oidioi.mRNA.OKI2018_I69.XSR.g13538.t1.cds [Oikopleura dioica]
MASGAALSILITLVCYVLPMILAFAYGFYIICNIKYEDSESEETCEKCNSRERSLDQIFGNESKMKGAAIITCSNCFVYCGCKDDPEVGKDEDINNQGTTNYGASIHTLPQIPLANGTGQQSEVLQRMEEIGQKLGQNRRFSSQRGSMVSMQQPESSRRNSRTTKRNSLIDDYRKTQQLENLTEETASDGFLSSISTPLPTAGYDSIPDGGPTSAKSNSNAFKFPSSERHGDSHQA